MSIMDMFRSTPAATKQQNAITQSGDPSGSNVTVPGADSGGNTDGKAPAAFPKKAEGEESPLSGYEKLWETDPNAKPPASSVPKFDIDPQKLMAAAKSIDFSKVIPADVLEKASKGDVTALGQAINFSAQAGYAQSAAATTKIVEQALTQQAKVFKEEIMPAILRQHTVSQTLVDETLLNNPAVKPMVDAVKQQFSTKYPQASAAEIAKHTTDYFRGFSEDFIKMQGFKVDKTDPKEAVSLAARQEDWGKFFNVTDPVG